MSNLHRVDARDKLTGRMRYTDDLNPPGVLHGAFVVSPVDRGRIRRVVLPAHFDLAEFTVVSAADIPGENRVPEPVPDEPFLAETEALWRGQPILAVAHADRAAALAFARAVTVEVDEAEAVIDPQEAMADLTRVVGRRIVIDNQPPREMDDNWLRLRHTYATPHQEQAYLETQAMLAEWRAADRHMRVVGSMQCPFSVKDAVAAILGEAADDVSIATAPGIGGAFGGKEDFPNVIAGVAALLAFKSGKPVKLTLDRDDDLLMTTKRHPSRITVESWTDRATGRLQRLDIDYRLDTGARLTLSPVVLARGVLHATSGYACPSVCIDGRMFHSDTAPNGAFRGFGAPQALFAIESHIDDIARELGLDPAEMRLRNILHTGDTFPCLQKVEENHLADCLDELLRACNYESLRGEIGAWNATHASKRGVGLSLGLHGGGYTGGGETRLASKAQIRLTPDGVAEVLVSNVEMGQGASLTLATLAAEGLGLPSAQVRWMTPDTAKAPNSGPTVASRTIYIVGNMLRRLGWDIRAELGDVAAWMQAHPGDLPRTFEVNYQPDPDATFDEETYRGVAYRHYSWAACAVLTEVDPDTAETTVKKLWAVIDVGKLAHRQIALGQAYGGIAQAVGWALGERWFKPGHGRMHGFSDYPLPTSVDAPQMDVRFIHTDSEIAKGLGELPMDFPAPAVRNAVLHATGVALDDASLLPETLQEALRKDRV